MSGEALRSEKNILRLPFTVGLRMQLEGVPTPSLNFCNISINAY